LMFYNIIVILIKLCAFVGLKSNSSKTINTISACDSPYRISHVK